MSGRGKEVSPGLGEEAQKTDIITSAVNGPWAKLGSKGSVRHRGSGNGS